MVRRPTAQRIGKTWGASLLPMAGIRGAGGVLLGRRDLLFGRSRRSTDCPMTGRDASTKIDAEMANLIVLTTKATP